MPATHRDTNPTLRRSGRQHWAGGWPLERVLFAVAGFFTALSAALAAALSPWILLFTGFVAVNQLLYAAIGTCGMAAILRRTTDLVALGDRQPR